MELEEEVTKGMQLLKDIGTFLAERRLSLNAGYAIPTNEDIQLLRTIINQLIELKFERDPDRDLPLEYSIIDRTKGRSPYFSTVPYESRDLTGAFQGHIENLSTAVQEVERIFKHVDSMKRYIEKIEKDYKKK